MFALNFLNANSVSLGSKKSDDVEGNLIVDDYSGWGCATFPARKTSDDRLSHQFRPGWLLQYPGIIPQRELPLRMPNSLSEKC